MSGFVHTLTAQPTVVGAVSFNVIENAGATVTAGVLTYLFPTKKIAQVQVVDASNCDGNFCVRLNYRQTAQQIIPLIDIIVPSAGEVLKSFAIEAPLLEVAGDGVRGLTATVLAIGGQTPRANLTIIVVERADQQGIAPTP